MTYGPTNPACIEIQKTKHRLPGETFEQAKRREADTLGSDKEHADRFYEVIVNQRFLAAGRIQSGAGRSGVTMLNCFASGEIGDSFVDGEDSIMGRAKEAATTMRMGGGIGYNFGTLRPEFDLVRGVGSTSGGPVSFMPIFGAVCHATSSYGNRRGAQMGVLPVWHPDIRKFIHAKTPPVSAQPLLDRMRVLKEVIPTTEDGVPKDAAIREFNDAYSAVQAMLRLTEFNISVGITDKFIKCLRRSEWFPLEFPQGTTRCEIDPQQLWDELMRNTWDWAEPGVLFIDRINENNNLWYCETITCTNPCAEQPLPPYGACLLGSFNLTQYIKGDAKNRYFDWKQFIADIPVVVEAMDNVVEASAYPLPQQRAEALAKRRMGLGVTGVANALEALGFPYGSEEFVSLLSRILRSLCLESYWASIALAKRKGSFPALDREKYIRSGFVKRCLPYAMQQQILQHGIRNSHLLSIAPTGTISFAADNISSSAEPVYSYTQKRIVQTVNGPITVTIEDYGYAKWGIRGKRTKDVTIDEHLAVLAACSHWTDSAVSKTCNVPETTPWEQFKGIYLRAYDLGCRGCTTFNSGGKRAGILQDIDDDEMPATEDLSCKIDPATGRSSCE